MTFFRTRKNKYNATRTPYRSIQGFDHVYDSKREAQYAGELDMMIRGGMVKYWIPQITFLLPGGVRARLDFLVCYVDGETVQYHEVKGVLTQSSANKYKQIKALFGIDVIIIR